MTLSSFVCPALGGADPLGIIQLDTLRGDKLDQPFAVSAHVALDFGERGQLFAFRLGDVEHVHRAESKQGGLGALGILGRLRTFVLGALLANHGSQNENAFSPAFDEAAKRVPLSAYTFSPIFCCARSISPASLVFEFVPGSEARVSPKNVPSSIEASMVALLSRTDTNSASHEVLPYACSVIGRVLLEARENLAAARRYKHPWVLVLEEAHNYARPPRVDEQRGQTLSRLAFERIAKEGRKFGFSLIIASQRPSEISQTIISQCANFISNVWKWKGVFLIGPFIEGSGSLAVGSGTGPVELNTGRYVECAAEYNGFSGSEYRHLIQEPPGLGRDDTAEMLNVVRIL